MFFDTNKPAFYTSQCTLKKIFLKHLMLQKVSFFSNVMKFHVFLVNFYEEETKRHFTVNSTKLFFAFATIKAVCRNIPQHRNFYQKFFLQNLGRRNH